MAFENVPALQGGGECGELLRAIDWTTSPLGSPEDWPPELHTVLGIALASAQPILIVWGPEQTTLYNDGYAAMCGDRHPRALGRPFKDLWFDIWDGIEPIITAAYNGVSTAMEDIQFTMHRKGYPEETHFAFSYNPVRDLAGNVLGMMCPCTETTATVTQRAEEAVERSAFMQVMEVALGAVAVLTGPDHVFKYVNSDYRMLIGHREVVGQPLRTALPEIVEQGFLELLNSVYRTGTPHVGRNVSVELQRSPNSKPETRTLDFMYHPIEGDDGRISGIFVQALDITERVAAEQQQSLLNRELGHRLKNQLALVQAIVNQTMRSAGDLPSASKALSGRVAVLANAHDILIVGHEHRATVQEIVDKVLSLHDSPDEPRFRVAGPFVKVASRPALSLTLILHELSTNAVKYGALSVDDGFVSIEWRVERNVEGEKFVLSWSEHGGPIVNTPTRFGSGSRLIKAGLAGTTESSVNVEYAPEGVRCEVVAELTSFQTER